MKGRHGQRLLVEDEARGGQQRMVLVGDLLVRDRRRLFIESGRGWEPAMVFLGESGLAMEPDSWERVFARASRRCLTLGVPVTCHPHMLRHSFALRMLLTLTHAFDRRMGLTPEERREYRLLFGDPWVLVQTLLGHRSPETTREIYLEPVSGLQVELFLNDDSVHEDLAFSTTVTEHLARSGTVNLGDTR
jgi:integrase